MRKKILLIPLILVALVLIGAGCGAPIDKQAEETIIKIGTISPLSGDAAAFGEQLVKVMEHQLPKINEKAQAKNIKFELIHEDGKCTGNDSVSSYQKLKDIDSVKFIIGGTCSSETLAIAPLTKSGEVLAVSAASSNPTINGASPYTYTFSYSDDVIGKTLAKEMSKHNKVAIISEQNDFNVGIRDVWVEAIAQYENVEVVANEMFPKGGSDFRVVLEKIKNVQPDAILLNPNVGVTSHNLIKQLGEIKDWEIDQLYGMFAFTSEEALATAPEVLEGMIIVDSPKMTNEDFLNIKDAIESEKGTLGDIGNYYTASIIDVMNVLTDLIIELGNDQKAVRDALADRTFDAYIGEVHFGDNNFPKIEGGIYIIKDGVAEYQN